MTALNQATQIPAAINTLEKMVVWAMLAYIRLHPDETYPERIPQQGDNGLRTVVEGGTLTDLDGRLQFVGRVAVEIDTNALASTAGKFWTFALENGNTALPPAFETD